MEVIWAAPEILRFVHTAREFTCPATPKASLKRSFPTMRSTSGSLSASPLRSISSASPLTSLDFSSGASPLEHPFAGQFGCTEVSPLQSPRAVMGVLREDMRQLVCHNARNGTRKFLLPPPGTHSAKLAFQSLRNLVAVYVGNGLDFTVDCVPINPAQSAARNLLAGRLVCIAMTF